jgi:divalent metal cation (Fe/Co/Zn/Cd) transporter
MVGILITIAILVVLRGAATEVYRRLMDAVDPAVAEAADQVVRDTPGVLDVEHVRLRWLGHRMLADVSIVSAEDLSLIDAHAIAHDAEHALRHVVPRLSAATVHVSPRPVRDR